MTDATVTGELQPHELDRITVRARSAGLYRQFVLGYTEVHCTALRLCLSGKRPPRLELVIDETMPRIELKRGWLWCRLTVHMAPGRSVRIGGLGRQRAEAIDQAVEAARDDAAAARRKAEEIGPRLIQLAEEAIRAFDGTRYIRYSSTLPLLRRFQRAARACRSALVRRQLDSSAAAALRILEETGTTKKRFESSRGAANDRFVASRQAQVRKAVRGVAGHRPTDEQATAIATDEDVTLVLAGAGAGKTAVITGKVAYLVRSQGVRPSEILVLAFNKKAAEEVKDRLRAGDLKAVEVRTFHGFGYRVIAETGVAPTLSPFAQDDARLRTAVTRWLKGLPELLLSFLLYHDNEYRSAFDFETIGDYYDFVRTCERRTLSGTLVKSLEEVQVANFLTANGIRFEYERKYPVATVSSAHRQYQPDFYLPEHDVYIEHFALDEDGRAPKHFRNYEEGVIWKRGLHEHYGTRLIETHSWQCRDGVLFDYLGRALEQEGVALRPVPPENLLQRLRDDAAISRLGSLLATFLQHVRGAGLSVEELLRRAASGRRPLRDRAFLSIFDRIRQWYETALAEKQELDYNDLIIRAAELIAAGPEAVSPYRYVLVDEFQDISAGRMKLLEALKRRDTAFFLVGDDWQSIYRFAGSDVSLFRNCGRHLGHVETCNLSQTFRYGKGILEPTAAFIQRNPVQTRRELRSGRTQNEHGPPEPDEGITVVSSASQSEGIDLALADIAGREGNAWMADVRGRGFAGGSSAEGKNKPCKVLALGRYRKSNRDLPPALSQEDDFSTVHRAKGREADYTIVLDLKNGSFPSRKEDDPVFDLVLPRPRGAVPHGEERRLFYVAATRAKRGTYLVADATRPSPFVTELLKSHPRLHRLGSFTSDDAPPCPRCGGALVPSESAKNLRCANHPFCRHLTPRCTACGTGYLVRDNGTASCTEMHCGLRARLCPRCDTGVLVLRDGPFGPFWGCSAFTSDPPCEYKERVGAP